MVYIQPISVLENDAQKLLRDFDIQTDHLISAGYYNSRKKRSWKIVDSTVPADLE